MVGAGPALRRDRNPPGSVVNRLLEPEAPAPAASADVSAETAAGTLSTSVEITDRVTWAVSSGANMMAKLLDKSTETFWCGRAATLAGRRGGSPHLPARQSEGESVKHITVTFRAREVPVDVAFFIDNVRDKDFRVSRIALEIVSTDVRCAGARGL